MEKTEMPIVIEPHDFWEKIDYAVRTPMNAILGLAELGLRADMPANVREYTQIIGTSGKKLMTTINNIIDYQKIERGEMEIVEEKYELTTLIDDAVHFVEEQNTPLEFKMYADKELPAVLVGDAKRLSQIVQNLLSNAIKFTEEGYISLAIEGEVFDDIAKLTFTVEDTGRGIKEEDKENIFVPFAQFDTKMIEGLGLGLTITKRLVSLLDGSIEFSSAPGTGSVFIVSVSQGVCEEQQTSPVVKSRRTSKKPTFIAPDARVLLVDDIAANLTVAEGFLQPYKMVVDFCESGKAALEAVKNTQYDLILMDYLMPEMTGAETAVAIRKLQVSHAKNVPIIATTANTESVSQKFFLANLMNDFLPKPIDAGTLNAILENWIPPKKQLPISENDKTPHPNRNLSKIKISGIDIKKGVSKMGGNTEIYLRVLKEYFESGSRLIRELRFCAEQGDLKTYHIYAHALNSISENIGAIEISREAASLEKAAERGDLSFVAINNSIFMGKLLTLLNNIHAAIKDEHILPQEIPESDDGKLKILLIDDTPSYLLFLSDILKDEFEPLTSINAQDGIDTARLTKPDLILLDLMMPGMSGYEALEIFKSDSELKHIPVILISGKEQRENEEKGRALGAVGYVKKPFDPSAVKAKVYSVLAS